MFSAVIDEANWIHTLFKLVVLFIHVLIYIFNGGKKKQQKKKTVVLCIIGGGLVYIPQFVSFVLFTNDVFGFTNLLELFLFGAVMSCI